MDSQSAIVGNTAATYVLCNCVEAIGAALPSVRLTIDYCYGSGHVAGNVHDKKETVVGGLVKRQRRLRAKADRERRDFAAGPSKSKHILVRGFA